MRPNLFTKFARNFMLNAVLRQYVPICFGDLKPGVRSWATHRPSECCCRTLNRKEQLRRRAVFLGQHGLTFSALWSASSAIIEKRQWTSYRPYTVCSSISTSAMARTTSVKPTFLMSNNNNLLIHLRSGT